MATDFFQRQDEARRHTGFLLVCFSLGVVTLIVLIYALCAFLFLYAGATPEEPPHLWDPRLFVSVVSLVSVVVGGGSLMKMAELASGGKSVALMLNGQEIQGNTREMHERRLLNIVEEMAIASGVAVPPVYLLPDEAGINAFAAGHSPGDAVVAVSAGCLTYLTRDELQGVVGHEFSHILNGDMRLNLRVIGLIFGIVALSQIGWVIMRSVPASSGDRKDNSGNFFLIGLGLYVLGLGGAFFGWLIQAAIARERECLADASAVQFTRNPEGIGGALKKIGGLQAGSRIVNGNAGEISHMFLADAFSGRRLTDLLATHPPLEERIRRLDPQFDGVYPEVKPVEVSADEAKGPQSWRLPQILPGLPQIPAVPAAVMASAAVEQVGQVRRHHVSYAQALQTDLPEALSEAARSPFSARALIFCLLLDPRPEVREKQLASIESSSEPPLFAEVRRLVDMVGQLPDAAHFPLVDLTLPALRQMSPAQHQAFRALVDTLIHADDRVSLFEYALQCVLTRYLEAAFGGRKLTLRYTSPTQVAPHVGLALSRIAWDGQDDATKAQAAFAEGMAIYAPGAAEPLKMVPREQCQLPAFDAALRVLAQASPSIKRQVVAACAACVQSDDVITVREGELLRAVCAVLGCPLPPLVEAAREEFGGGVKS